MEINSLLIGAPYFVKIFLTDIMIITKEIENVTKRIVDEKNISKNIAKNKKVIDK